MKKYFVKTNIMSNLYAINKQINNFQIQADVKQGRYVVDINSILGLFALDWSIGVTIEFLSESSDNEVFIDFLKGLLELEITEVNN